MRRPLNDTRRTVRITIDNQDRADIFADGRTDIWTANAYIDGDPEPACDPGFADNAGNAFVLVRDALERGGHLDDPLLPVPDDETLRLLIHQAADSWSGDEMPDWRDNEYARGQVELIWNTCNVRTPDEDELEGEDAKDRITDWIRAEEARVRMGGQA